MSTNISKWLIILLLPSLILGTFFANLISTLLIILFLIDFIKEKNFIYFKNSYSFFFAIFYSIIFMASLFSDDILFSFESSLFYFRFYLISISIWYFLDKDITIISLFNKIFSLTLIVLVAYAIYQSVFFLIDNKTDFRISSLFGDEKILGSYISRTYLFLLALILYQNTRYNYKIIFIALLIFLVSLIGVILSGERTAVLYFCISFVIIYIGLHNIKLIYRFSLFVFLSVLVFIIILIRPEIKNRLFSDFTLSKILNENYLLFFNHSHKEYFEGAISIFKENLFLGVGPKLFRIKCEYYNVKCSTHPHNSYLQLLTETGLIGFTFLALFFIMICYNLAKKILLLFNYDKNYLINLFFLTTFFINLFPFVQNGNFFGSFLSIIYFFPVGFYLFINNKSKNN